MKERPILFSGPLVRAILEGRKTVTRRPVSKANTECGSARWDDLDWSDVERRGSMVVSVADGRPDWQGARHRVHCRIEPGDRLWVRETWMSLLGRCTTRRPVKTDPRNAANDIIWRADGEASQGVQARWDLAVDRRDPDEPLQWTPSIHMPRWASRLTLEVTGVGVERVQDITEGDAMAEGCTGRDDGHMYAFPPSLSPDPRAHFAALWDDIYGNRDGLSWAANPWVWVVRFRRVEP